MRSKVQLLLLPLFAGTGQCISSCTQQKADLSSRRFTCALATLLPELKKCAVCCHNCHGEIHGEIHGELLAPEEVGAKREVRVSSREIGWFELARFGWGIGVTVSTRLL